jgi:hypothetical protein
VEGDDLRPFGEVWVAAGGPRAGPPPAHPFGQQDPAHLAAAHLDALGLGGLGERVQGPVRCRLGIGRRQESLAALLQATWRLRAGQLDDPAALGLGDAPGQARAGQVGQPVDAAGVEAVQPLVDRLGVAALRLGEFGDACAVPAAGDDAGTLDPAGGRVAGSGELAQTALLGGVDGWSGAYECRHGVLRVPHGHDHGTPSLTLIPNLRNSALMATGPTDLPGYAQGLEPTAAVAGSNPAAPAG